VNKLDKYNLRSDQRENFRISYASSFVEEEDKI